jgi:hypothetical protein
LKINFDHHIIDTIQSVMMMMAARRPGRHAAAAAFAAAAACLMLALLPQASALYSSSSPVIELTPSNFDAKIKSSKGVWLVEFYAPWCVREDGRFILRENSRPRLLLARSSPSLHHSKKHAVCVYN